MGNSNVQENNIEEINPEDIIENDCYEEIDLKKINKIIEEEKNWNKNSIIYSVNQLDLNQLNDENHNQNENNKEHQNYEPLNNVIVEQKNEEGSEDIKIKENNNEENKNINIDENKNENKENKENKEEEKQVNKEEKEEKKEKEEKEEKDEKEEKKEKEVKEEKEEKKEKKEEKKDNNNEEKINNVNEKNDEKIIDNNINTLEKNKNNIKVNNQVNVKSKKYSLKVKNIKPRIRPKNTSDEVLNGQNSSMPIKKRLEARKKKENSQNKKEKKKENNNNENQNNNENNANMVNDANNKNDKKPNINAAENNIEEFDIKNIIPEYRLSRLKDDEIIYSGTLEKILKIPEKNSIVYSQRFCIFTKNYFAYYKSKESYISLNKPMLLINNNHIIRIENTTLDGGSYYFGIICEVNDDTRSLINKVNSFVTEEGNCCELLLGFRTKEYENMMKWVVVLRYFISKQNEEI